MLKFFLWLFAAIISACVSAQSLTGSRILAIVPSLESSHQFSSLYNQLKERSYDITVKAGSDKSLELSKYDENLYDHVLFLCPKCKRYGKSVSLDSILKFIKNGGNILFTADSGLSPFNANIASEFGITFESSESVVSDHSNYYSGDAVNSTMKEIVIARNLHANRFILPRYNSLSQKGSPEIFFKGIGHKINRKNHFIVPVLSGSVSTFSSVKDSKSKLVAMPPSASLSGFNLQLVSTFQSLNNARLSFIGSTDMLKDSYFELQQSKKNYGNADFIKDLTMWTFHESGVLKHSKPLVYKTQDMQSYESYQVKDLIAYQIDISEYRSGKWHPFTANDVQLEVRMLDPYIRVALETTSLKDSEYNRFEKNIELPDKYGVFKFQVTYKRAGLSWMEVVDTIPIQPLRHDQFPRFLSQAYPYYSSSFVLLGCFVVLSSLWLFSPAFAKSLNL